MPDRDTVIKGLEYCESDHYCHGPACPYFNKRYCIEELTHDALELLKEAEPVKRGMWIDMGDATAVCSECNNQILGEPDYDFCPNCGADMRGGEESDG